MEHSVDEGVSSSPRGEQHPLSSHVLGRSHVPFIDQHLLRLTMELSLYLRSVEQRSRRLKIASPKILDALSSRPQQLSTRARRITSLLEYLSIGSEA